MPSQEQRNSMAVDIVRIKEFLGQNQLVQANAVLQKVESRIDEAIAAESKEEDALVEHHPWWKAFKSVFRAKNYVLGGKTKEALLEINSLAENL